MEDTEICPVHLHRVDAAQNMRRFYMLVIRNWGRIGSGGQTMMQTFDHPDDANTALSRLERTKRRRGYGDAGSTE
jgi:predicted DNA-binding WGR domain protein